MAKKDNKGLQELRRGSKSPYIYGGEPLYVKMLYVIAALLPAAAWGIYSFGVRALLVILISVGSSVATEAVITLIVRKKPQISDLTAVVTGLILAMTFPAAVPLWIPALGGVIAIVSKQVFGGTGKNFFNPALLSRTIIILIVKSSTLCTQRHDVLPLFGNVDESMAAQSAISALNDLRFPSESGFDLFFGLSAGNIGEIAILLLIVGGIFLAFTKKIRLRIPLTYLLSIAVITYIFPLVDVDSTSYVVYSIMSGGVVFVAFFAMTDHTTSPRTGTGQVIFAIGCAILTVVFRYSGIFYEGAYPAILIMNELSRPIDLLSYKLTSPAKKNKKGR